MAIMWFTGDHIMLCLFVINITYHGGGVGGSIVVGVAMVTYLYPHYTVHGNHVVYGGPHHVVLVCY